MITNVGRRHRHDRSRLTREEHKLRTRRALIDAALELLGKDRSFTSLSLREVARHAGVVPNAFYRHFPSMDALALVVLEEGGATLRRLLRQARPSARATDPTRTARSRRQGSRRRSPRKLRTTATG